MFDKKVYISVGLALLIAYSAIGSVYHIKQTFKAYQNSETDYISETKSNLSHDYTTIKSADFLQSVYSNEKLEVGTYIASIQYWGNLLKVTFSKSAIFYTLHYIQSAISKMLYPFHTFW